jgi:hypothetical protein
MDDRQPASEKIPFCRCGSSARFLSQSLTDVIDVTEPIPPG